jgi:hypothetical protein
VLDVVPPSLDVVVAIVVDAAGPLDQLHRGGDERIGPSEVVA